MKYVVCITMIALFTGCSKKVPLTEVLKNLSLSRKQVISDGRSTVSISAQLGEGSSTDRRNVVFMTSSGVFVENGSNKYTAKAEFDSGKLVARATLRVSTRPATIRISVKPEYDDPLKEYELSDTISALRSVPATLTLQSSSFGIASNHLNEVFLVAMLKNSSGGFVSTGYRVVFENFLLSSGGRANGQFRVIQAETTDSSLLSAYYSAPILSLGTQIKIRARLLDGASPVPAIADSVIITINQ